MKKPTYKGKELLPLSVIDAARDGDSQAVDQVLRYYEGYINKLCTRTLYDPDAALMTASASMGLMVWMLSTRADTPS